jgi:hypothetical protein
MTGAVKRREGPVKCLVHYVFGLVFAAGGLLALPGAAQTDEGFGERAAGTYFVEQSSGWSA